MQLCYNIKRWIEKNKNILVSIMNCPTHGEDSALTLGGHSASELEMCQHPGEDSWKPLGSQLHVWLKSSKLSVPSVSTCLNYNCSLKDGQPSIRGKSLASLPSTVQVYQLAQVHLELLVYYETMQRLWKRPRELLPLQSLFFRSFHLNVKVEED